MKRAFTLIELLVVISIIAMLSSIIIANVDSARAKSRDAVREQQIRQIDLATQMYIQDNGHAPYLTGCEAQSGMVTLAAASACFAVSTAGVETDAGDAWLAFKADLNDYLPNFSDDPCEGGCSSDYGDTGYVYVAPLALQYQCYLDTGGDCGLTEEELDQLYALYAELESDDDVAGNVDDEDAEELNDTFGQSNLNSGDSMVSGPLTITNVSVTNIGTSTAVISWSTNKNSSSLILDNISLKNLNNGIGTSFTDSSLIKEHTMYLTGLFENQTHYFKITATDSVGDSVVSSVYSYMTLATPPGDDPYNPIIP